MTTIPQVLRDLKFAPVAKQRGAKRRLFLGGQGPFGSGKTRFITTMPGPTAVIDFDRGMEGVAECDQQGNPIYRMSIEMPDFDEKTDPDKSGNSAPSASDAEIQLAKRSVNQFKSTFEKLIKSGAVRSVVVDNGGSAYNLFMAARFGQIARLGEVPAQMWRLMQQEFENVFNIVYDYDVNCYITHREKLKFMGLAGEKTLDGYDRMMNIVQVHLGFYKEQITIPAPPGTGLKPAHDTRMGARIIKCRQNLALELERREFEVAWLDAEKTMSVGLDFLTVATTVFPNTTEEDWF
jgi:hypothetical protein